MFCSMPLAVDSNVQMCRPEQGLCLNKCHAARQGTFQVVAAQPVSYTIQEVVGLLELDNEVRHQYYGQPHAACCTLHARKPVMGLAHPPLVMLYVQMEF